MIWHTLVTSLYDHLSTTITNATVQLGDTPNIPKEKTIVIVRGTETPWPVRKSRHDGVCQITLYLWEHHLTDKSIAYSKMNTLEAELIASLKTWSVDEYKLVDMTISPEPDHDLFTPSIGTRITLGVTWRVLTI